MEKQNTLTNDRKSLIFSQGHESCQGQIVNIMHLSRLYRTVPLWNKARSWEPWLFGIEGDDLTSVDLDDDDPPEFI